MGLKATVNQTSVHAGDLVTPSGIRLLAMIAIFLGVHLCKLGVIVNRVGWTNTSSLPRGAILSGGDSRMTPLAIWRFANLLKPHHPPSPARKPNLPRLDNPL